MCLTIPKKVLFIDGNEAVVENSDGIKQNVKSIVQVKLGDYVLTQQNIIVEKIGKREAKELINIIKQNK